MVASIHQVSALRQRLQHSWLPFFGRFGKLTPVQLETIPKVLSGANVVVASPTASGKTEAVMAPVAERFATERWNGLAILYIVPTRALANDTLERVAGPLQDMGITTQVRHGDKPHLQAHSPPHCLITTPESLDSLVCRHPSLFRDLRAVVLDEIHLVDNTYRGDQLRILLQRLRDLSTCRDYSVHLLSATLTHPQDIASRYVTDFEIVKVGSPRKIEWFTLSSLEEVSQFVKQNGWFKVLFFCNMRESAETVAVQLTPLWRPYPVLAHHGSLSRQMREEAEQVMREADVAVCVATSTLEVGIDIGDIDVVVLAEIPWSLSSLLQRIGRGSRRDEVTRAAAVASNDEEREILKAMFRVAGSGILPQERYEPDPSVVVQQIFSYLYQHRGGVSEEDVLRLVSPLCTESDARSILHHLRRKAWVEHRDGYWFATTRLVDMGDKGLIHSNIPDSITYRVIDIDSGREIGKIGGVFDDVFVLARQIWKVVAVTGDVVKVHRFTGKASLPYFQRHRDVGAFHHLLPPHLQKQPRDADSEPFGSL